MGVTADSRLPGRSKKKLGATGQVAECNELHTFAAIPRRRLAVRSSGTLGFIAEKIANSF